MKRSVKNKKIGIKPELAGGFFEYGPAESIIRQKLLTKIRKTFEDFGFDPIETPAIERMKVLLGGEETSEKIIFQVRTTGGEAKDIKKDELALRFDLTVPLARFVAANPEIPKPFKRYQIGQVFRGESPQAGRYREFTQADIDIVGTQSLEADAEIITMIYAVFKNLGINKFTIRINNRKILNALPDFAGFPEKKLFLLLRLIDKKDKIGEKGLKKEIVKLFSKKAAEKIFAFLSVSGNKEEKLAVARDLLKNYPEAEKGIQEMVKIARLLEASGVDSSNWDIDFSMVRGLGYYTGPIFETVLNAVPSIGSVFSGGRYDNLAAVFTGEKLPAVGASLGVDRLFAALETLNLLKKKATVAKALILNLAVEWQSDYFAFAKKLREAGVNTAVYIGDDRAFQAQLAYAVKKEIPYVIIYGEEERKKGTITIKDMLKREQKEIPKNNLAQYFKK